MTENKKIESDIKEKLVAINRITKVVKGGRRFGFAGRLYNHAILVKSNIMKHGNTVKGWAFVPQEGNTIISTLHAFLLQTNHESEKQLIEMIKKDLVIKSL